MAARLLGPADPDERALLERLIEVREDAERDRVDLPQLAVELARELGHQDIVDALTGGRR